ncbi:helix-turn-helix domain-containing protein [Phycicoccus sp. SLBN-51]|uniref:helix-turn-helix domain-containing protein n=1 Tax=Phycicoccus sp. SLBN-51 TaxID=2768447 RepID=UPI00114EE1D4|nr:helix-turn-helix domain-containing protein [Phycicoccus sp. SLBN-51]TQJ50508.1 excisionase family DNA binding protein [Phycicoccus sp. SLBN-51]
MSKSRTTAASSAAPAFTSKRRNWVTGKGLAEELDLDRSTIYRWIDRGWLVAYHVGGQLRIDRADLDGVIARRVQPGELRGA